MTPAERWGALVDLLRLASMLLHANDRGARALDYQEPRSLESLALWQRLMRQAGHG
jgi:hypothetical protein